MKYTHTCKKSPAAIDIRASGGNSLAGFISGNEIDCIWC